MLSVDHVHLETPLTWTREEARLRLHVGQAELDKLIDEGQIQLLTVGSHKLITEQSIHEMLAECRRSTPYRIGEAAQQLGVPSHLLRGLIDEGKIETTTSDGVTVISGAALEAYITNEGTAKAA